MIFPHTCPGFRRFFSFLFCFTLLSPLLTAAQSAQLPPTPLPLQDLSAFRPAASNWQVAGDVFFDRQNPKIRKTTPGQGVLVNLPAPKQQDNLFSILEHGDVDLELEFMMAPGSNSGVYLQGRYEVQIFDSWGKQKPTHSDAGGIYQRWDESRPDGQKGFEGHGPRLNASRAPGLWQHFRIVFRAPRFDAQGRQTANARFVKVEHNGVTVHENVELSGPTRSAGFDDEKPLGPLMLQGDHGPVAFRNIRYKAYGQEQVQVQNLRYQTFDGQFEQLPNFTSLTPVLQGQSPVLLHHPGASGDQFAGQYTGTLLVPATGTYLFELELGWITSDPHFRDHKLGAGLLTIGGRTALTHPGKERSATGQVELKAGEHPFTLSYFKNRGDRGQSFVLYAEGPGVRRQALATPAAQASRTPPGAITVAPDQEPVVLRSFVNHGGKKRTHCVSVADPSGAHYSLDLRQGALLQIWKGDFAQTTTMWHGRGDAQVAEPQGSVITLSGQPSVALLSSPEAAWPDSATGTPTPFRFKGYRLDPQGRPSFNYELGQVKVQERLVPDGQGRQLQHELTLTGTGSTVWCRLAEGSRIERLKDGSYSVNDKQYYVMLPKTRGSAQPQIRKVNGREELLLPVPLTGSPSSVSYSIVW
jgi:hypothetical protein